MRFAVATWNINSVRLRFEQVARFLADAKVDVFCLQETKCPDDRFPLEAARGLGYPHIAHLGQKGYNGVAIFSRYSFARTETHEFCGKRDARHIAVTLGKDAKAAAGIVIENLYIPAGGDIPDPEENPKFAHKLSFLDEFTTWSNKKRKTGERRIALGDLNVAPLEHDVWSHKQLLDVVSHTPIETDKLSQAFEAGDWTDAIRRDRPEPQKVYSWWSYRSPDWLAADKGRRLDHIWLSRAIAPALKSSSIHKETRSWDKPSDHVPLVARFEL